MIQLHIIMKWILDFSSGLFNISFSSSFYGMDSNNFFPTFGWKINVVDVSIF